MTFEITATSLDPMTYQRQHDGVNVFDGIGTSLTLSGVDGSDNDTYDVVATTSAGSITMTVGCTSAFGRWERTLQFPHGIQVEVFTPKR